MTEKIYERDSYCKSFTAVVESCKCEDGAYYVVLDRTAFFPEGGGQAADIGMIDGVRVLDVQEKEGKVIHKTEAELTVGAEVNCEIDWELRYSRMQSHSGEHILSGIVHEMFGYDNVGFHMSESSMTVDFNGTLTAEDIERVELEANRAIYQNADIIVSFPEGEELANLDYRSKLELTEGVRIITIGDVDICACCAPHVAKTGEIGLIKVLDFGAYKQGTRLEMVAGLDAVRDYISLNTANKQLMKQLSVPRQKVKEAVLEQQKVVQNLKGEMIGMSRRLALALCELKKVSAGSSVYAIIDGVGFDDLRYVANDFLDKGVETCLLLSKAEDGSFMYVVSSKESDTRPIVKALNETFSGKGGGKPNYAQGKLGVCKDEELQAVVENLLA